MGSQSNTPNESLEYRRLKNKEEMKKQILAFSLSIFLTIVAFIAVATDAISDNFTAPFILVLAVVQVIFQLYYFMHLKHKGHEAPSLFIWSGVGCAAAMIAGLTLLSWL